MPYYSTILDGPFGKQQVVVLAGFAEEAKLLTRIFDCRQIGSFGTAQGVYSPVVLAARRTTKAALKGMSRYNDPRHEIWSKSL